MFWKNYLKTRAKVNNLNYNLWCVSTPPCSVYDLTLGTLSQTPSLMSINNVAKMSPINEKGINKLWKLPQTFSVIKSSGNLRKHVLIASILSATALLKIVLTEHLRSKRKTLCRSVDYRVGLNKKKNLTQLIFLYCIK